MAYYQFSGDNDGDEQLTDYGSFETFCVSPMVALYNAQNSDHGNEFTIYESGWYWLPCFSGCLPDGPAEGPFTTEAEAIKNARGE